MHRFLVIFLCFLLMEKESLTDPLVRKAWRDYHLMPTNKHKVLEHLIMAPSQNLSMAQKDIMLASCKKVHQRCLYAEECCSQQCVKRYKRCIHFWT